jgi:hypothetical protein
MLGWFGRRTTTQSSATERIEGDFITLMEHVKNNMSVERTSVAYGVAFAWRTFNANFVLRRPSCNYR